MYSSTLSLTSALGRVGGRRHTPAALPPGNTRYTLYRKLRGSQGRSGQARKISLPPGFDPRTVQLVVSRYTDYALKKTTINISQGSRVEIQSGELPNRRLKCLRYKKVLSHIILKAVLTKIFNEEQTTMYPRFWGLVHT
jgi:hypothetical protein